MRAMKGVAALAALGLVLAGCNRPLDVGGVDGRAIASADKHAGDWLSYGRSYDEQRFSPLARITDQNAGQLGLAWFSDLDTTRGQEATPLEVDGVLYVSTAWSKVRAYDVKSGRMLWQYDPKVPGEWGPRACCDVVNRGVALWKGKVYVGTLDGRLVALDAKTGREVWSVQTFDKSKSYSITGAPRIVKGKVIIGEGGAEYNLRGFVSAYDADTGKLVWRFWTVPRADGKPDGAPSDKPLQQIAARTWAPGALEHGGGGTVWDTIAYDPELDLLYFGTDNGDPWNQGFRGGHGDNLFLTSIIAVKPDTGEYVWHYQVNPGDEWDYSATQQLMLADLTIDGQPRKVIMQAPKDGFFYVLDRKTGELLSAKNFVPVNWAKGIDPKTGRPILNPEARYSDSQKPWVGSPGPLGGHSWNPMAYSPKTGLVYIPANVTGFPYIAEQVFQPHKIGFNTGLDFAAGAMPNDLAVQKATMAGLQGYLLAWDPVKQKEVWRAPHPGPANGGVVATAGNVVFQGTYAGEFAAYAADSGKKLWSFDAQAPIIAAPSTFEVGGEQYVAVLVGGGGAYSLSPGIVSLKSGKPRPLTRLLVFKLGGTAKLPPVPAAFKTALNPPPLTASPAEVEEGFKLYSHFCGICHGDTGVSGGVTPDLRYSPLLASDSFFDVVLGGALKDRGMISFAPVLTRPQVTAIRSYLIKRAHETQAAQAKGEDLSAG
jgi:alcohol dehydrogenase (cytochrome c)/quinohemoprotein ethanol dehydrogenase